MKKSKNQMKKTVVTVLMAGMMVSMISGCSDKKKDPKVDTLSPVVTQEATPTQASTEGEDTQTTDPEVTAEPTTEAVDTKETEAPDVVYYFGDEEEEGSISDFAMMDFNYYGPIGGYVEMGAYDKFTRNGNPAMGMYLSFGEKTDAPLAPKDYFDHLKKDFGTFISGEIGLGGVEEWEWFDQQVFEEVTVNGLVCLKFSGVVGGKCSYFADDDTIYKRFVTGYATQAEKIYGDKDPYYEIVYVVASYDTDNVDGSGLTDETKEQLQHNVDTLMSTGHWELPQDKEKYQSE